MKRRNDAHPPRLPEFSIMEQISLMRGWYPRQTVRTRWRSWPEFYRDSDLLREELLADETIRRLYPGMEIFADRVRRLQPPAVHDVHHHLALHHAHGYVRGDAHTHDSPAAGDAVSRYAMAATGGEWPLKGVPAVEVPS